MDIINDNINFNTDGQLTMRFDSIWQRVMPELEDISGVSSASPSAVNVSARKPMDDAAQLREFINEVQEGYKIYSALSARRGSGAAVLRQLAADKKAHLRQMETIYFILTGNSYTPAPKPVDMDSVLSALRERYMAELENSERYAEAAKATENARLSALYSELAEDAKRHAIQIEELIGMIMR